MNYKAELQRFVTSQYIYSGVRITLACVVPAIILAHFGILKEYFLFPLATSFVGLTDQPGPFIRRRNALILAIISFVIVAFISILIKHYEPLVFVLIAVFGMLFTMIGVYGQRLAAVGSLSLVVMAIFLDHSMANGPILKSMGIFLAGCIWFFLVFLLVSRIQPYKLAFQMVGENYLELAEFLRIRARYYQEKPEFDKLFPQIIAKQIDIKNQQEATREIVFKTRTIVNESTTTSRLLMMMFLNSLELHEKLMTSDSDYEKINRRFGKFKILPKIHDYLILLSEEITNIGIAMQSGAKAKPINNIKKEHQNLYEYYFNFRNQNLTPENLEDFMILRLILIRVNEITDEINSIYKVFDQDISLAKSLSSGLDYQKFVPYQEKINLKVLKNNLSIKSEHFRHAIRITLALLIGYGFSYATFLGLGHTYWILITITAILKPSYSTTKTRNLWRLGGTVAGGVFAYVLLMFVDDSRILLTILFSSMILCFTFLRGKYLIAVFFMTIYVFLTFNFMHPGNVNIIFRDRLVDTFIAGIIAFIVSYLVLPVWQHSQNIDLMKESANSNIKYFESVMQYLGTTEFKEQNYRLARKDAMISLANLSDNFQRMISDPKTQQIRIETVHQFVTTSHLITAYIASLSQYAKYEKDYPNIDIEGWHTKILAELQRTEHILNQQKIDPTLQEESKIIPEDFISELLENRKKELQEEEQEFFDRRDMHKISYVAEIKNIKEILSLLFNTAKEQRRLVQNYYKTNPQS